MSAAKIKVPVAERRAAIFRNVAIRAVSTRFKKGSIRSPLTHSCGPKWIYCEHRWTISQHAHLVRQCGATATPYRNRIGGPSDKLLPIKLQFRSAGTCVRVPHQRFG